MQMPSEPTLCRECGGPLNVVHTEGRPDLADRECMSSSCSLCGVNQSVRALAPGTVQLLFGASSITRVDHRSPSQGEDNCESVARELLASLGPGFAIEQPCPAPWAKRDSKSEQGFDFSLRQPCGHVVEVQVTRVPDGEHFAAQKSASRTGTYVLDQRAHSGLVALVEAALEKKTRGTPPADRSRRILAIDGLCPSVGFTFFLTGIRFTNTQAKFGWRGVVIVAGLGNAIWLGSEAWPPCVGCPKPTDHGDAGIGA